MTAADPTPETNSALTPEQAEATLRDSARARSAFVSRGRWLRRYLAAFAVASVLLVLAIGLGGRIGVIVGISLWGVALAILIPYALRQGVSPRHIGRRVGRVVPAWAVLYGGTLAVGLPGFAGRPAFWVPAALLTAVPFAVGAALPLREGANRPTGPTDGAATTSERR